MGRPPKLTPEQRAEVDRRLVAGESIRSLAREFGVGVATIMRGQSGQHTEQIRNVAKQLASAQTAFAALPLPHQQMAMDLAGRLRNISESLASAAELGAKNAHRLQALANGELQRVPDDAPLDGDGIVTLKGVAVLTKMANDAAATPLNLMAANKPAVERINAEKPPEPAIDVSRLSNGAIQELLDARAA